MSSVTIQVLKEDITQVAADAMVNAANSSLMGGGGVDGAIHRAAGPGILEECKEIVRQQGHLPPGNAVITGAGNLPARYVIHTVGPVWKGGAVGEAEILASCYRNSLILAKAHNCRSVAFPNISTGAYGYPKKEAARVAVESVRRFLQEDSYIKEVLLVCFDAENEKLVREELERI